jgi:hypothetical protein
MTESRSRLPALLAALPDFGIAGLFLLTWIAPRAVGIEYVGRLLLVMLLEFIVVHSAGFMGAVAIADQPRAKKVLLMVGLGGFYTLFVGAFGLAFSAWWPLGAFWALVLNRLLGVILGQAGDDDSRMLVMAGWAAGVVAYLGTAFATIMLPVPRLGMTEAVVQAAALPGSGLWIEEPHRVLAMGFLYFSLLGLSGLADHRWFAKGVPARTAPPPA